MLHNTSMRRMHIGEKKQEYALKLYTYLANLKGVNKIKS